METVAETASVYPSQRHFQGHVPVSPSGPGSRAGLPRWAEQEGRGRRDGTGCLLLPEDSGLASVICIHRPASGAAARPFKYIQPPLIAARRRAARTRL